MKLMTGNKFYFEEAPEYFPGLDFFALVSVCTHVRLRTDVQYRKQSFQNRAKIRTPQGWQWLTVPVIGGQHGKPMSETLVDDSSDWRTKHLQSLRFNYQSSPFFDFLEPELMAFFDTCGRTMGDIAAGSTRLLGHFLGVAAEFTDADLIPEDSKLTRLHLSGRGREHIGQGSGKSVVSDELRYRQNFDGFEHGMSALDLMCNYGPEAGPMVLASVERPQSD